MTHIRILFPSARGRVAIIGHRGAPRETPENTLASFRRAFELGADAIELDVRLSRDGAPIVMHDATLERTTDGADSVSQRTLAQLKRLDAGSWFDPKFRGERIPTLEEALALVRAYSGRRVLIEQ
jgi:glycerophosphoryl diester phosphodiesterase